MSDQIFFIVIGILYIFSYLITIVFSLLVIVIVLRYCRSQSWSIINLLLCNSSVCLLVYIAGFCVQVPLYFQSIFLQSQNNNTVSCKIFACFGTFGITVLSYSSVVQAISRLFVIVFHKHRYLLTTRVNWIMIFISWTASGTIAGCFFISPLAYQYEVESRVCSITRKNFPTSFMASVVIFLFPLITISSIYSIIIRYIKQHSYINPQNGNILRAKRNIKVFKNILIYTSVLGVGGTPYFISTILNNIFPIPWPLYLISLLCMSCTAAISSVVLLFTNEQVKTIFFAKLYGRQVMLAQEPTNKRMVKTNQIVPYCNKTERIQTLPAIN